MPTSTTPTDARIRMNAGERTAIVEALIASLPAAIQPWGVWIRDNPDAAKSWGYNVKKTQPKEHNGWYGLGEDPAHYLFHKPVLGLIHRMAHVSVMGGRIPEWVSKERTKFGEKGTQKSF